MASHIIQNQIDFSVQGNQSYYLHVVIGNGQVGSTNFQNVAGTFFSPDVFNSLIGQGSALVGKTLNVISVVMEVNPNTNNMIVSYYITNQQVANQGSLSSLTPTDTLPYPAGQNDTVTFMTQLKFN